MVKGLSAIGDCRHSGLSEMVIANERVKVMITMVKVSDLLRNVTETLDYFKTSEPSEWLRMITDKSADEQFATIIRLIETEGFTDPIGIMEYDGYWLLGNGHHRMAAAILLGLDEIPVVIGNTWPISGNRYDRVQDSVTSEDRADSIWISDMVSDARIGNDDSESITVPEYAYA